MRKLFGLPHRFTNNIFLETRFQYGLNNMAEDPGTDQVLKNRYFAFRLGYSFPLGK